MLFLRRLFSVSSAARLSSKVSASRAGIVKHYLGEGKVGRLAEETETSLKEVDEFHLRGRTATLSLLSQLSSRPLIMLDIGCGLGGPLRTMFQTLGGNCYGYGVDIVPEFVNTALSISQRHLGSNQCYNWLEKHHNNRKYLFEPALWFECVDAVEFLDREMWKSSGLFNSCWFQHVLMNITHQDKHALFKKLSEWLVPRESTIVMYEILLKDSSVTKDKIHLPLPFASSPEHYHLMTADQLKLLMRNSGFETIQYWRDVTTDCIDWLRASRSKDPDYRRHMSHLLGSKTAAIKSLNMLRNLEEGNFIVVETIFTNR